MFVIWFNARHNGAIGLVEKKTQLIYDAVKMDPLTGAQLTLDQIDAMVAEMIEANKKYLADFK